MIIIDNEQNHPKAINLSNVKFISFQIKAIIFHFMGEDCEWRYKDESERDSKWNAMQELIVKGQSGQI
jgi:hypothetical protein